MSVHVVVKCIQCIFENVGRTSLLRCIYFGDDRKHKIIPTILSRCQIFDFNRIQVDDITKHLEYVAKQEEVKAEEEALHIIAQKADGALRDALSIFDQIVSFGGTNIT